MYFMKTIFVFSFLVVASFCSGQSRHSTSSIFKSYKGLVLAGYQGWFNAPEDGANRKWNHYSGKEGLKDGSCKFDMWPDVSEYAKTYNSPFQLPEGKAAKLFSSYDAETVQLHFKWMKDYGIDGVFVQRFVSNIKNTTSLNHNNVVLKNAIRASRQQRRAIALMYDLSGMKDSDDTTVINDWKNLVDSLKLTAGGNDQTYLFHNGKPLVAIWGVGFEGRNYSLKTIEKVIDFLKNDSVYGGCSILLGLPTYWRTLTRDADTDPRLHDVIRKCDIVQPWMVGRYNESSYPGFADQLKSDLAWCKTNMVDYVPVVFPGFSWHNMYETGKFDQIPRNKGSFFWKQLTGAMEAGCEMIYVAMFDEIDEATAIFKISNNPPEGKSRFVTFEPGIPGDYYLQLTGKAAKMLRKEIPFKKEIPAPVVKNTRKG